MDVRKVVIYSIVFVIISQIVHTVSAALSMPYYQDPAYFPVWSRLMMPLAGPTPMEFFVYSSAVAFLVGIIYGLSYVVMERSLPGKGITKGMYFGVMLFLLAGVPSMLGLYLLINLPPGLLSVWSLVDGLLLYLIAGVAASHFLD